AGRVAILGVAERPPAPQAKGLVGGRFRDCVHGAISFESGPGTAAGGHTHRRKRRRLAAWGGVRVRLGASRDLPQPTPAGGTPTPSRDQYTALTFHVGMSEGRRDRIRCRTWNRSIRP